MIKHIVIWKLHNADDASRFQVEIASCRGLVPGMRAFEVAVRQSGLDASGDVLLYSVFEDRAALQAYQDHPKHQQVSAVVAPLRASRQVFDYEIH